MWQGRRVRREQVRGSVRVGDALQVLGEAEENATVSDGGGAGDGTGVVDEEWDDPVGAVTVDGL